MTDTNAGGARPASDVDALIERLQGFNPPDRTIASQRDYSQAIHEAADALIQLRERIAALEAERDMTLPAPDLDALIERLQKKSLWGKFGWESDEDAREAADALVQLREERDVLKQDAERTHERICQAIDCRNMGDHAKGWDILRQWLVDVADAVKNP